MCMCLRLLAHRKQRSRSSSVGSIGGGWGGGIVSCQWYRKFVTNSSIKLPPHTPFSLALSRVSVETRPYLRCPPPVSRTQVLLVTNSTIAIRGHSVSLESPSLHGPWRQDTHALSLSLSLSLSLTRTHTHTHTQPHSD